MNYGGGRKQAQEWAQQDSAEEAEEENPNPRGKGKGKGMPFTQASLLDPLNLPPLAKKYKNALADGRVKSITLTFTAGGITAMAVTEDSTESKALATVMSTLPAGKPVERPFEETKSYYSNRIYNRFKDAERDDMIPKIEASSDVSKLQAALAAFTFAQRRIINMSVKDWNNSPARTEWLFAQGGGKGVDDLMKGRAGPSNAGK